MVRDAAAVDVEHEVEPDPGSGSGSAVASGVEPESESLADAMRDLAQSRIVHAAQVCLSKRGLDTTVDDVALEAGVSRRTVFRHFATRDRLLAAGIREGLRSYGEQVPPVPEGDLGSWLLDLLLVMHRKNARNGRIYWELSALEPELTGELAAVAAERRDARKRFAQGVTATLWKSGGGRGRAPEWLADTVAVHLSGFTTQSLAGDFDRTPDEVAQVSARVIEASLHVAVAESRR